MIEWIKKYIHKNLLYKEKIIIIFQLIANIFNNEKKDFILYFLNNCNKIDLFKSLPMYPSSMSWWGSQIPHIEKDIEFLNELLSDLNGFEYLEHRAYLKENITSLEKYKQNILIREYLEELDLA